MESLIQKEKELILSEHRDIRSFLERRSDQAVRGERVAQSELSEAGYHTRTRLEKQKDY